MNIYYKPFLRAILIVGFLCYSPANAEITVNPIGFAVSVEEDRETEVELVLENSADDEVLYQMRYRWLYDNGEERFMPRRDEPGEILQRIRVPYTHTIGLALDTENEWMWSLEWSQRRLYAIDLEEYEVQVNVATNLGLVGMFYLDGVLYAGGYAANGLIYRYDTDGRLINTWRLPIDLHYNQIAGNDEYIFTVAYQVQGGHGDVHVWDMENLDEIAVIDCSEGIGDEAYGMEWVSDHQFGQLWLTNRDHFFQYYIDEDWNAELIQSFETVNSGHTGIAHDGENLWRGTYSNDDNDVYIIDDGIRECSMLSFDPEDGIVPGNESEIITITANPVGYEAGVYNIIITVTLPEPEEERDDPEQPLIEISAIITVDEPTYSISGRVIDAATEEVIEETVIEMDGYLIRRFLDEDGIYIFENLPQGEYELSFSAPDYLPTTEAVDLGEDDVELNVEMLYAEFLSDEDQFFMALEPDMEHTFEFEVSNGGNGPLTYLVERRLANEDANADPWELRNIYNAEETVEDNQLNGVVIIDGLFYISGGNNRNAVNKIHVLNQEGDLIRDFNQFHESDYGMRDLCWDGELIWGADEQVLYGFDTEGELVREINGEADSYRSLTYNPENDLFISANITSDIYITNLEGNLVRTIDRPGDLRSYGLAYWSEDPDGYNLYTFSRGDGDTILVNKVNLENGDLAFVNGLDLGGRPGGIDITNQLDVYSWVFVGMVQSPDRIGVWQLAARRDWFLIEPEAGEIAADESNEFILTFDATGLPVDNSFEGELVFNHDGIGGQTVIPVRLDVVEGRVPTFRELDLNIGWNMVSVNVQPDEEDIEVLLADLVEAGLVIMMKDGAGHFYRPDYDFNNIPGWFVDQGYQIKMRDVGELCLEGVSVLRDDPIQLDEGWNLASYYPSFPIEATLALSNIEEHLIIAKDGFGNFYIPEWEFSNIGNMRAGQGYYLNVDAEVELRYTFEREEGLRNDAVKRQASVYAKPGQLSVHSVTGSNMSLLVLADSEMSSEIGVYSNGELIGSGVLQDGLCGIAVWGDDLSTDAKDGAVEGDLLEVKLLNDGVLRSVGYTVLSGENIYSRDGLSVIQLTGSIETPYDYEITSTYPNPFNSQMQVSYSLPEAGNVKLSVYDLTGRSVMELFNGHHQAGMHTTLLDGSNLASGIYLIRFETSGFISQVKVALVR
ncbi:MAG: T9SS type A sorting domain-containing protein [Candidatus Hatepunaea meridiana]|nr:T9SS type A sorting domain-containing protein [Candidatus Hatepunaea meridiana]